MLIEKLILHVEDDDGNAYLIKRNLKSLGLKNEIIRFVHGNELFDFLSNNTAFESYIIFLDINLPYYDGFVILEKLKAKVETNKIPVIMISSTDNPNEIKKAYSHGCENYFSKPVDYSKLIEFLNIYL